MKTFNPSLLVMALAILAVQPLFAQSDVRLTRIATIGDGAQDTSMVFTSFPEAPVISNRNHVLFEAIACDYAAYDPATNSCPEPLRGLFQTSLSLAGAVGSIETVVLEGTHASLPVGFSFVDFFNYEIADSGDIAFLAIVDDTVSTVHGVYYYGKAAGEVGELAREGADYPVGATPDVVGSVMTRPGAIGPVINGNGEVAFYAREGTDGDAILFGSPGSPIEAARNGSATWGSTTDFAHMHGITSLVLNDDGTLAFDGQTDETSVLSYALFTGAAGFVEAVYSEGDIVYDDLVDTGLTFHNPNQVGINEHGTLFFLAKLNEDGDEDSGLHTNDPDHLAQEGVSFDDTTGDELGELLSLNPVLSINNTGAVALLGQAEAPSDMSAKRAILGGRAGELRVLARTGDTAMLGGTLSSNIGQATIGDSGLVVFPDDHGLYFVDIDGDGELRKLIIPGDPLPDGDDDPFNNVTVRTVKFQSGSGNSDGRPSGFNNAMMPVVQAYFSDGSEGIFLVELCDLNADGVFDQADFDEFRETCKDNRDSAITRCERAANVTGDEHAARFKKVCM